MSYRNLRWNLRVGLPMAGALSIVPLVAAKFAVASLVDSSSSPWPWGLLPFGIQGVVVAVVLIRYAGLRVVMLNSHVLEVRNPFRTYRLDTGTVEEIRDAELTLGGRCTALRVVAAQGRPPTVVKIVALPFDERVQLPALGRDSR